jgi:hypothetical protein
MKKTRININSVYYSICDIKLGRKYSMASDGKISQTKTVIIANLRMKMCIFLRN